VRQHIDRTRIALEPDTGLGRASMFTFGAAIVLYTLSIALGPRGIAFFDEPWWAVATIAWVAATIGAFITACLAIFRQGERSIVTIAVALLLAMPVGWIVFELSVPHAG
jgi:hypothetical protein